MIPQIPKQKIPLRGFDDDNIKPAERLHLWRMYFDKVSRGQGLGFLVIIIITAIKYHDRKQLGQESVVFHSHFHTTVHYLREVVADTQIGSELRGRC